VRKAEDDLAAAERLNADDAARFREVVAFHCQQSAEKYIKALLTANRIDFPKTHSIQRLLELALPMNGPLMESLLPAHWLTAFAAETRYPSDTPECLPGDEAKALALARRVREAVLHLLSLPSTPVSRASQFDPCKSSDLK